MSIPSETKQAVLAAEAAPNGSAPVAGKQPAATFTAAQIAAAVMHTLGPRLDAGFVPIQETLRVLADEQRALKQHVGGLTQAIAALQSQNTPPAITSNAPAASGVAPGEPDAQGMADAMLAFLSNPEWPAECRITSRTVNQRVAALPSHTAVLGFLAASAWNTVNRRVGVSEESVRSNTSQDRDARESSGRFATLRAMTDGPVHRSEKALRWLAHVSPSIPGITRYSAIMLGMISDTALLRAAFGDAAVDAALGTVQP